MTGIAVFGGGMCMFNYTTSHMTMLLVIGIAIILMGIASLFTSYLQGRRPRRCSSRIWIGMVLRRYTADSPAGMYVDGPTLFVTVGGAVKTVKSKLLANSTDWAALAAKYPKPTA